MSYLPKTRHKVTSSSVYIIRLESWTKSPIGFSVFELSLVKQVRERWESLTDLLGNRKTPGLVHFPNLLFMADNSEMNKFHEQNWEICICAILSLFCLQLQTARGMKRNLVLFKITHNTGNLFKVLQNYHFCEFSVWLSEDVTVACLLPFHPHRYRTEVQCPHSTLLTPRCSP